MKIVFSPIFLAFKWLGEAFFPVKCLKCGKEGAYLCQEHRSFLSVPRNVSPLKNISYVFAAVAYDDLAEKLIDSFKFRGAKKIANLLADEIVNRIDKEKLENAILVPIPLHWTRKLWRGFNQAEVLAIALGNRLNIKVCNSLKRKKRTFQQSKLKKNERQKNIKNAFVWTSKISPPHKTILVDDVAATGATLDEAANILKENGVKEVLAIVFARGKVNNKNKIPHC